MLSFSTFGSTRHPQCEKVRKAVELLHKADPTLIVDGEVMADVAVSPEVLEKNYPFSPLKGGANVLIFPDLASANIAYKLLSKLGGRTDSGPDPDGHEQAGACCATRHGSGRNRERGALAVVDAREAEPGATTPEISDSLAQAD